MKPSKQNQFIENLTASPREKAERRLLQLMFLLAITGLIASVVLGIVF